MKRHPRNSVRPGRRDVVVGGAAMLAAAAVPQPGRGADAGLAPAGEFTAAARSFLTALEPDKRKAASFAWNGSEWRGWTYFGVGGYIKPGLRLEQMSAAQKAAAWNVLKPIWSDAGVEKARNVMVLQDVLAESGNGTGQRSSERFSFAIFGEPSDSGPWGFRLEGHHLSHSVAVRGGRIVSITPSAFSALPNRVRSGRRAGLVTLKGEEMLARKLAGDLNGSTRRKALASESPLSNILSYAGRERANAKKVGVPAAELAPAQRDLLWQLIETYAVDYLSAPLADAQRTRLRTGDREAVHFAWYGPNTPERAFGYRVIGDGFVIEMGSVDPEAQHLHTVYNDLGNVLGRTG